MAGRFALRKVVGIVFGAGMLLGVLSPSEARAEDRIFGSNYTNDTVAAYPRMANGDIAPSLLITTENGPHHVAINHGGRELFVAHHLASSVSVYNFDTGVLKRTISGDQTGLNRPTGVAVDERHLELFVTNDSGNSITVYDLSADGNSAPLRTIVGPSTGLSGPAGIAVDLVLNEIVVSNYALDSGGSITVYPRNANGNLLPLQTIQGPNTGLKLPQGITLDLLHNEILVANSAFNTPDAGDILIFSRMDTGNIAPLRALTGPATQLCNPMSVALDLANDELIVANSNFGGGACSESFTTYQHSTASGNTAPIRTISGVNSTMSNPSSVAFTVPAPVVGPVNGPTDPQPVGAPVSILANFTDSILTIHTCTLAWGDGTETPGVISENSPADNSGTCMGSHTYSTPGTRSVLVTVGNGSFGSASSDSFVVVGPSPTITSLSLSANAIIENGSTTLNATFTDPDGGSHTVTINWGDGSSTNLNLAAGVSSLSASHQYLDDNPTGTASDIYGVSMTVADPQGNAANGSANVTVHNVAPIITSVVPPSGTVAVNNTVTVRANFTDAGAQDIHSCSIAWGDGQTTSGVVSEALRTCTGTHAYTSGGNRSVVFTLNDDDGGSATANLTIVVVTTGSSAKIVFTSTRDGNAEIYTMNADGTGLNRLTNHSAIDVFPAWSPDRTKIVFTSTRNGNADVYVMNASGTGVTQLTSNAKVDGKPTWSPNGTKVAFTSNRDGNFEIYVMNANGTGQTRITNSSAADTTPAWSPDGTKIAFSSNRSGTFEIYSMNANGSGLIRLTNSSGADLDPDWSPDGTKIAFTSNRNGLLNFEIYVMNANGTGVVRLTTTTALGADAGPAWSPNGTQIAFTSNRDGLLNFEIYVMNANGTNPVRRTNNLALDLFPEW